MTDLMILIDNSDAAFIVTLAAEASIVFSAWLWTRGRKHNV